MGLILGIIGLVKSGSKGAGKGLSIAAIVLAPLAIVVSLVVTAWAVGFVEDRVKDISTAENSPATVTGKIGQPVKDGRFTFVVKSVRCGMVTSEGLSPSKPGYEFCAVHVSVSNDGNDRQSFDPSLIEGFIGGDRYVAHSVATEAANSGGVTESINPGRPIQVVVLIDVPAGKSLDKVEVHDGILSDGTSVSVT